jgi:endonuclease/exonuclease/phosphatase family metal-dependent hydrolase
MGRFAVLVGVMLAVAGAVSAQVADPRRITVMSYNLENFFDTKDNPAREGDNVYLPLSAKSTLAHKTFCERYADGRQDRLTECLTLDWSDDVLKAKAANLAAVIKGFEGRGPDILVVSEVENAGVLEELRKALPDGASYRTIINLDDSPGRGINVGIMSRLPLAAGIPTTSSAILFPPTVVQDDLEKRPCGETRNLTAVTLELPGGAPLTVYSVHMPATGPAHPCRAHVAGVLAAEIKALPPSRMVVVAGDTNLNCNPPDQKTIADILRPLLTVPDEVNKGCRAPGTSFFRGTWSFLDLIMTNRLLLSGVQNGGDWFADFGSFRTVITAPDHQVSTNAAGQVSPMPFDVKTRIGTSDHWPVAMDLIRRR